MNYLSLDYIIILMFLLITVIIGIKAGKGVKDLKSYAIGDKIYGVAVLVFTFIATNIGGASTIDAASNTFSDGIIETVASLGVVIQILIFTFFITPHMHHFSDCFTMGDVMERMYGKTSKIITGCLGTLYSFCMIGMELFILGNISQSLLNIPASWGIIGGGILLAVYSAHGGIKAVTATDVFQFLILFIVIPIIATIVLHKVGGIKDLVAQIPADKFHVLEHPNFSFYLTLFLIWSVLPLGLVCPPIFQRLLMAKKPEDLRNQYLIVAGLDPLLRITVMIIGLGALILYPHIEASEALPHIIKENLPIGIKGVAISGMLAVIMSTVDSYLHTAGLLFVHDVLKPITGSSLITKVNEVNLIRIMTISIGTVSIFIALYSNNVLNLSFSAMRMTGPILLFPLLAGIMGLKPDKRSFYGAMAITMFAFMLITSFLPTTHKHLGMPMSILINTISFLTLHFFQNNRFVTLNRR